MRIAAAALAALLIIPGELSAEILVQVDKSAQRMTVSVDGELKHTFVVSTGLAGGPPSGTYRPQRLERKWNSRLFNWAPMPYSIFFDGHYAIHGTTQISKLGRRASKGCVRLHPSNAEILFALVQKRKFAETRIVIGSGPVQVERKREPVARVN
jgi:lipoprotein-anchoring transpeptidase ErfK/SrfK